MATKPSGKSKLTPQRAAMVAGVKLAINHAGSKAALARYCDVEWQFIHSLSKGERPVPARICRDLEKITLGEVKAAELLPEVFG